MIPKILIMAGADTYSFIRGLGESRQGRQAPCIFVPYDGLLTETAIAEFIDTNKGSFDAVAVFGDGVYSDIRKAIAKHYNGLVILLQSNQRQAIDGNFAARIPLPVSLSDFDKIVSDAFANL